MDTVQNFLFQKGYIQVGFITDKFGEIGTAFKQLGEDNLYVYLKFDNNRIDLLALDESEYEGCKGKYKTDDIAISELQYDNIESPTLYHEELY